MISCRQAFDLSSGRYADAIVFAHTRTHAHAHVHATTRFSSRTRGNVIINGFWCFYARGGRRRVGSGGGAGTLRSRDSSSVHIIIFFSVRRHNVVVVAWWIIIDCILGCVETKIRTTCWMRISFGTLSTCSTSENKIIMS